MATLTIIAAIARNGVIGRNNTLPWHLPADLAFFKRTTSGHTIIMGRKNHEDIGRALPDRRNIVISRNPVFQAEGCEVLPSLEAALEATANEKEVFIIGGAQLYQSALHLSDKLIITHVEADVEGDVYFPEIRWPEWKLVSEELHDADDRNSLPFRFAVYTRK